MIDTILPLPASLAIAALTLAYTPPNSKLRLLAGLVIAVFNWIAARSTIAQTYFPGFIAPEYILGWVLACNNWLNLARLHYTPPSKGYEQPYARLRWAIYQIFDTRWSVHPSQIPHFDKNRPRWVPSRRYFLLWKIWTITWCGLIIYAIKIYEPLQYEDLVSAPSGFLHRLSDVTLREAWLRVYYGFSIMIGSYCCLCFMHAVCGFIAVAVFMDDPAGWRPLHGSPLEALGMRGLYHKFWHHCMRKGFTTHSVFLVNDVLRLPRRNPIARYLIVIISFLISGLYHAALVPEVPPHCALKQIPYQLEVVGAILFEDVVAILWKKFAPRSMRLDHGKKAIENGSAIDGKSSDLAPSHNQGHVELRRRKEKNNTRDYPKSPMPKTPTVTRTQEEFPTQITWVTIVLYGIVYLWTAAFILWANSRLVWSTNQCIVEEIQRNAIQQDYYAEHSFNEPF